MSNETKQKPDLFVTAAKVYADSTQEFYKKEKPSFFNEDQMIACHGASYIGFQKGSMWAQENNPYKTACESINPDNPMAVAENLKEMVFILSKCAPALREAGYKTASKQIEELLTKIQSK